MRNFFFREYSADDAAGEGRCRSGMSQKYCHPEFISASIEYRHAELVSASLVQGRFRVRPGMTAAAGSE